MTYAEFLRAFGAEVRQRRQALRLTQADVAFKIDGFDQAALSRVERGIQGMRTETLFQLASALGLPLYRLFGGADPGAAQKLPGLPARGVATDLAERIYDLDPATASELARLIGARAHPARHPAARATSKKRRRRSTTSTQSAA